MDILNISAYHFVALDKLPTLKVWVEKILQPLSILGTVLLSPEGINMMLAGPIDEVRQFQQALAHDPRFAPLIYKESYSDFIPYEKRFIKVKNEAVTMGVEGINPGEFTAQHLSPEDFKQWLDENRDITVLDTRNAFEFEHGTFDQAIHLNIENFRDFPAASDKLDEAAKEKPMVMFCTGGIRCEKASALLLNKGFKEVYQLEGGIINYFEKVGGEHYHGDCFVFDERELLNSQLEIVKQEERL